MAKKYKYAENNSHSYSWAAGYGVLVASLPGVNMKSCILELSQIVQAGKGSECVAPIIHLARQKIPCITKETSRFTTRNAILSRYRFFLERVTKEISKAISALLFSSWLADLSSRSPQEKKWKKVLHFSENQHYVVLNNYRLGHRWPLLPTLDSSLGCLKLVRGTWGQRPWPLPHPGCSRHVLRDFRR